MNITLRFIVLLLIIFMPADSNFHYVATKKTIIKTAEPKLTQVPYVSSKVILITIDGVRWQDIFEGTNPHLFLTNEKAMPARYLLPNMYHYFVDEGMVIGESSRFVASGPNHISLPGYLEIMRGHPSIDCQFNECEPNMSGETTIADLFETSVVFGSWDTIRKAVSKDVNKFVVDCGRNYRSARWKEANLSNNTTFPEYWEPLYRPDILTQEATIEYLQHYRPQFVWVSLGDTDEWGHAGDYARYINSLIDADNFIGQIITMTGMIDYTFIITADHGRSIDWRNHGPDMESAELWLMMSGKSIPAKGFVSYPNTKSLSNILPTVKELISGTHNSNSLL